MGGGFYMLDTLKISKRSIKAGMPPQEAEAVAKVLKDCEYVYLEKLATKDDIKNLKEYMHTGTIVMTFGFTALGFLIAYLGS